jgi:hypothetical protein
MIVIVITTAAKQIRVPEFQFGCRGERSLLAVFILFSYSAIKRGADGFTFVLKVRDLSTRSRFSPAATFLRWKPSASSAIFRLTGEHVCGQHEWQAATLYFSHMLVVP